MADVADKRKLPGRKIAVIALIFTVCFIWGNSLMTAEISAWISNFIREIINLVAESATGENESISGDGVLRKIAHALEFAALGAEIMYLVRTGKEPKRFDRAVLWGLCVAFIDETLQLIQPGRSAEIKDVWIDFGGFIFGCLICFSILRLIEKRKTER